MKTFISGGQIIHSQIGEDDGCHSDDEYPSEFFLTPVTNVPEMEVSGKDQPGDQGPVFFGIPAPVVGPGHFPPPGAEQ